MRFDRMRPDQLHEAVARGLPFVLPIGVMEYHGRHLPAGVDLIVVTEMLDRLGDEIVVLPPFAYGAASHAVAGPEDGGTLHVDAAAILPFAEALFASLLRGGYRNIHGIVHHQTENFVQGMPTDLVFRLAARNAIFRHLEATRGPGWWGAGEMADYYRQHAAGTDPFAWIQVHPLFPEGADFPFDHAGEGETALMLALAPETVDPDRANGDGHWYTDTAPRARADRGAEGVAIALTHLRRVLGLEAGPDDTAGTERTR
ncbi:MAG: creatinine amidohydrolase [Rhodobacteraceae bacterium HLUCCA08]|nr:MAG: creatinine amidohydrolase [Rhodobacteraceae bacterium HLUCCA08]